MKRRLLFLFVALTAVWLQSRAQIRYEQWLDDNRTSVHWGNLILGEQTFQVDVASMPYPGLHFLNILPYDESGEPGVWRCIAFLMPEYWPGTNDATQVEYWVTGDDQQPHRQLYAGTAVTLDIDASRYSPGMHFFNYRTLNARGEGDTWKVIPFLVPEGWPATNDATLIEYWVTGYDSKPHRLPFAGGELKFNIDISKMSYGLHFFNYRTLNEQGEGGAWKQIPFYINNGIFDDEFISYEYWIDEQDTIMAAAVCPGVLQLEIDMENLSVGMHTLYFRANNWSGIYGETFSYEFEVVDDWDAITSVFNDDKPFDIYTIDGKKVRHQVTSLKGLPKGIYIYNGKKQLIK